MQRNVCKFIPVSNTHDAIHTINFVLETKKQVKGKALISSLYRMCYVTKGKGIICQGSISKNVTEGDIFFIFPAVPYSIESVEDFEYMYISYIGVRANKIMESMGITNRNFVFGGFFEIADFWKKGILCGEEVIDLMSESVLLYTFSLLGKSLLKEKADEKKNKSSDKILLIKKYIDDNFSDSELSLDTISERFSYNKKYISAAFKERLKIGFSDYLSTVRVQHSCALMEENYTSVTDIAFLCGFKDQMYFSKVFKKKMGMSPKEHMRILRESK